MKWEVSIGMILGMVSITANASPTSQEKPSMPMMPSMPVMPSMPPMKPMPSLVPMTPTQVPSGQPLVTPTPVATPSSSGTPVAAVSLTKSESTALLREFLKAQHTARKALIHRQNFELKELKASQRAREKQWEQKEKEARHEFFGTHTKGPERRTYIQDFIKRRKEQRAQLAEEKKEIKKRHEEKLQMLKDTQDSNRKEFRETLEKGQRPSDTLWPQSGL